MDASAERKDAIRAGKRLLAAFFSILLVSCMGDHSLRHAVATEWKATDDYFYRGLKLRTTVRNRHYFETTIASMDDAQHKSMFRMGIDSFKNLVGLLTGHTAFLRRKQARNKDALTTSNKVHVCLYHLATGLSFRQVGQHCGLAPATVMRIVWAVTGQCAS